MEGAGGSGEPSRSAREQRQGAAIARQLARELRQSTTLFAQQEPRRATSGQNSPSTPPLTAFPGQNSPSTPEMAQFGAIYACRESFVPLSPPRSRAGRILYRTRGRVGASHDTTTGTTSAEGTGATTGPRCSTRGRRQGQHGLAGPAWVGRASMGWQGHLQPNFACNSPRHEPTQAQKPQNINDQISILEILSGELHAKLLIDSQD